jgi:uncharacterized protein YbjT (DUF2867 family)
MQNWRDYQRDAILSGRIVSPMEVNIKLQQIAVEDIGLVAATAFADPAKWIGREIDLAGDACTMTETAATFSRVLGREVKYVQIPWEDFRKAAGEESYKMYRWFNDVGYSVDIPTLRREFPELATLEQYVRREWTQG